MCGLVQGWLSLWAMVTGVRYGGGRVVAGVGDDDDHSSVSPELPSAKSTFFLYYRCKVSPKWLIGDHHFLN